MNKDYFKALAATWLLCGAAPVVAGELTQQQLNDFAQSLAVSYRHLDNRPDEHCDAKRVEGSCFKVELSLTPAVDLPGSDWAIYLSHISPMQSFVSKTLMMEHLNGDLHRIKPTVAFTGFKAGETQKLLFRADGWSISRADAMPNYYIVADGLTPSLIVSTKPVIDSATGLERKPFVKPYQFADSDKNFKRYAHETTPWATHEQLYADNADSMALNKATERAVIPTPKRMTVLQPGSTLDLSKGIVVKRNNVEVEDISVVIDKLASFGVAQKADGVRLNLMIAADRTKMNGSYSLAIKADRIDITGVDEAGVANGLQSLAALLTLDKLELPLVEMDDEPRYEFRGLHVDVARNFHSKKLILKLLDQMAAYKLNKLHLHLADDEGWRLQIDGLEELTEIGSKRCFDPSEDKCLLTQLGSGPESNGNVNGYYSKADYIEILRAAKARHIQVIPSLDMPGHSRAAVKSMEARYRKYMKVEDSKKAKEYLLSDMEDTTVYQSIQYYSDNTINVCMPSAYTFVDKVIEQVLQMHNEAGHALTRYHIGADETAGAWVKSPQCTAFLQNNPHGITEHKQLGGYFVEQVAAILSKKGVETAAWGDGLMHTRVEKMPKVVQANAWTPLFSDGYRQAHELVNRNWQVVISSPDTTYFDFPYEADPEEYGYYWASRQTNTRKVFEFMPDNLPLHAETRMGRLGNPQVFEDTVPIQKGKGFYGMQGQLWSENVRSEEQAEYMLFPRLLALAERAWHKADWEPDYNHAGGTYSQSSGVFTEQMRKARDESWNLFANVVAQKELPKLDVQGVFYRIPTVGAKVEDNKLKANVIFPGMIIEYQINDQRWKRYQGPVAVDGKVKVRAVSSDGSRKGRILTVF